MEKKILLIEDENLFADPLIAYCESENLNVHLENTGESGLSYLNENHQNTNLLLLDMVLNQGKKQGEDVLRIVKKDYPNLPVLCMSAIKIEEIHQIISLTLGADDYYDKSNGLNVLILRIKNILEKNKIQALVKDQSTGNSLLHDNLSERFTFNGKNIALTAKQYKILLALYNNPNKILPHERLKLDANLSPSAEIPGYIKDIRRSLEQIGVEDSKLLIETEISKGYRYNPSL
jgi:DNA-binding response OmpR family regulator